MKLETVNPPPASPPAAIHVPAGFRFASCPAGIKPSGRADLALVTIPNGATAAALFTRNLVVAAPVTVGRKHLKASDRDLRALLVNSGNANCATGPDGIRDCERTCRVLADLLQITSAQVFPSSTGIIGVPLPTARITAALPTLFFSTLLDSSLDSVHAFAEAIRTTDTRSKIASARLRCGSSHVSILGIAKGAGMIHPNLATMLVYLFTDVAAPPATLRSLLRAAADQSFNCISIDGDTSTNDTVLLLASGASGVSFAGRTPASALLRKTFPAALDRVCQSLAQQIVADGEGVHHLVRLHVTHARTRDEALQVARAIATSSLVKTAWAGSDPNWGRVLAAVGRSGVRLDPDRVSIRFGPHWVCRAGKSVPFAAAAAHTYLTRPEIDITVQLGRGRASLLFLTSDLTADYVRINAEYST